MIKFTANTFVAAQYFTPGMVAQFDAVIEAEIIDRGHAVTHTGSDGVLNADHADTADLATLATNALTASSATTATSANHATTADSATSATSAGTSGTTSAILDADDGTPLYAHLANTPELLSSSAVAASCASTAVDEVLASFTIEAGTLGVNSILQIEPVWSFGSSANNKILKVKVGGVTIYTNTRTTTTQEAPLIVLANRNSLASQIKPYDTSYAAGVTYTLTTYTIDFSNNVTVAIIGQRANSGDALTLEYYRVLHFTGA